MLPMTVMRPVRASRLPAPNRNVSLPPAPLSVAVPCQAGAVEGDAARRNRIAVARVDNQPVVAGAAGDHDLAQGAQRRRVGWDAGARGDIVKELHELPAGVQTDDVRIVARVRIERDDLS